MAADAPELPPDWRAAAPADPAFRSNCEACAIPIQAHVGGSIATVRPKPAGRLLGAFKGVNSRWTYHVVVVNNGYVYDAFTGAAGLSFAAYKALWQYADAIDFGF